MYAVTSTPDVKRTRATLRSAEFGFFGVTVWTRVQTPRRCGAPFRAGVLVLDTLSCRPFRTNCAIVGTQNLFLVEQRCWSVPETSHADYQSYDKTPSNGKPATPERAWTGFALDR